MGTWADAPAGLVRAICQTAREPYVQAVAAIWFAIDRDAAVTTPFSASASFQGYLYQCAYALVAGMQRLREFGAVTVRIECLDDVDFSLPGSPVELLQLKHHNGSNPASLSDASPDMWGSLRVWMSNLFAGQVPSDAQLFLITAANASAGSAAALLGTSDRDPESA